MTKIEFGNGSTVTIRDGVIQVRSPALTALLDTLATTHCSAGEAQVFDFC